MNDTDILQTGQGIGDATPAVLMVLMIFIFPKVGLFQRFQCNVDFECRRLWALALLGS
jgi:hypothetical protein